ncbi:alpha/beta fold hydrolase [Kocuria sediminis]|uniref:Alpha/beta fold hydrolase n=1 Tax=Kocuria sediminis TaxID=1038857 RepID=A0A6N8GL01_9MICC|nr:alpha/beta fold hydrolase [Kocuria sediminis]MUN63429.1 alpha/beta fold hydrolase [Kocuria sediminis]
MSTLSEDQGNRSVTAPDGRRLEFRLTGPPGGLPVVFHHGAPSAAVPFGPLERAAADRGLQVLTVSRPGYGASDPLPEQTAPGTVAGAVADTRCVLDELGAEEFLALGWSSGGPRALACGALLPGRCRAVASLAGYAPPRAEGLDPVAGMDEDSAAEFTAARQGRRALEAYLAEQVQAMTAAASAPDGDVVELLRAMLPPVDRAVMTGDFADYVMGAAEHSLRQGIVGWRDDDLAVDRAWGFAVEEIAVPTRIWHGREDRAVPVTHGEWLAAHVPGARAHLLEREGHLSLVARLDRVLDDLLDAAEVDEDGR